MSCTLLERELSNETSSGYFLALHFRSLVARFDLLAPQLKRLADVPLPFATYRASKVCSGSQTTHFYTSSQAF